MSIATGRFLRMPEVRAKTGLGRDCIYKLIREGDFPKPVKLTKRASGWSDTAVQQWVDARLSSSGSRS